MKKYKELTGAFFEALFAFAIIIPLLLFLDLMMFLLSLYSRVYFFVKKLTRVKNRGRKGINSRLK